MGICFFVILICICIGLIFRNIYISYQIKSINKTLEDIKNNNNIRLRFYSYNKHIKVLGSNINFILNSFQEIAEKNKFLEDSRKKMISNISHDIRTPLTSILGYLEALNNDINLSGQEKKVFLEISYDKSLRLHSLLEEFFEISKLESEDILIKLEKVNLTNIVKEVLVEFYQEFINANREPIIDIPSEEVFVYGEKRSITRILSNLLSNAIRYSGDEKIIGIKMRKEENEIWIDVWNNGEGIPKKDIPYIFDRLYTVEKSRNEKLYGSGLGLSIAKELVERQKGKIKVESIENEKTTFSFSLPICK